MASEDRSPEREASLIAAAQTAASWARAQRSTWTSTPLDVAAVPSAPAPPARIDLPPVAAPPALLAPLLPALPDAGRSPVFPRADEPPKPGHSFRAPVVRWLLRAAAVMALAAAAVTGGLHLWKALPTSTVRMKAPEPVQDSPPVTTRKATGGLRVKSTPAGAQVLIDGKPRGVTPLTLTNLSPGRHAVAIKSNAGTVQRTVTVAAAETAEIDESIFPGWLAVFSPFDLTIIESGRVLRPDERSQMMLPPGTHELRLVNKALAFDAVRQVDVQPGETTVLRLTPPPSTLTVTASEAAEVWLDGARVGQTPVDAVSVPLGTHDVVVRRASGAERRFNVTIGVNPFSLNVDFTQPANKTS